jgi:hypothetical protein
MKISGILLIGFEKRNNTMRFRDALYQGETEFFLETDQSHLSRTKLPSHKSTRAALEWK